MVVLPDMTTSDPRNNLVKLLVRAMHSSADGLIFDPSHGLNKLLISPEGHLENCFRMECCEWISKMVSIAIIATSLQRNWQSIINHCI